MDMLKRISGVVLVVMAVVVAVHSIVEPLYYTSTEESPYSPVWAAAGPTSITSASSAVS